MAENTGETTGESAASEAVVSQEQLRKAESYIEAEEGVVNRLIGLAGTLVTSISLRAARTPASAFV